MRSSASKRRQKLKKRQKREVKIKDISHAVEEVFEEVIGDINGISTPTLDP